MLRKFSFACLLLTCLFSFGNAQTILKQLSEAYQQSAREVKPHCILDIIQAKKLKNPQKEEIQQIVLIRHGEPLLNKEGLFSSYMAQEYSRAYDEVEVMDFDKNPVCLDPDDIDTIYSSNLVRAINTAEKIIGDRAITLQSEPLFREFEREIIAIPFARLPLNFWLVFSRLMWYTGLNTSYIEGISNAKKRVSFAAQFLEYKSSSEKPGVLVAHGMFNKSLAKELKKRGWTLVYSNGSGYLNVRVLAKVVP